MNSTQPWSIGGGMPSNPYLGSQAQAIISQSNQNLQNNILPGINSGAMAAGGFGGSRQGIAQGLAIQGQQQSLNNSLASMYGSAYQNDQNLANQTNVANIGAKASMYGANKSAEAAKYGADSSASTAARGQDLNYNLGMAQNQLGYAGLQNTSNIANAGNATQLQVAGMNNATQTGIAGMQNATTLNGQKLNYSLGQQQNALGYAGLGNQLNIAGMNNATTQRGQDQSYNLGLAQNSTSQRGQDQSYNLGLAQNSTSQRGQDLSYNLGLAQNSTSQRGQDLSYNLGLAQNSTSQRGQDLSYGANIYGTNAGMFNSALSNATQRYGQDLNYGLGMTNANNTAQGQMMNFYTNNRQLDQSGLRLGADLVNGANQGYLGQGQGIYNLGLTQQNAPWNSISNMNAAVTPYSGYGTTTATNTGSQLGGALGGALGAAQLYKAFSGGNSAASSNLGLGGYVPTTDYSTGANYNLWG